MLNRQVQTDPSSAPTGAPASGLAGVAGQAGIDLARMIGHGEVAETMVTRQNARGSTPARGEKDATPVDNKDAEMADASAIQNNGEDEMDIDAEDYPMVDAC